MKRLVIAAAAAGAALALAPLAQADQTVTVQQACGMLQVGTQPYSYGDKHIACVTPEDYEVGEYPKDTQALQNEMQSRFPGSHKVDPNDPWSDWVIPGGQGQQGHQAQAVDPDQVSNPDQAVNPDHEGQVGQPGN
ncbi:hypothetical protein [Mycolicibacterium brumae]|uniref:hypothetical protein n=1 Tax=Mycolicibacterium brumae TaxID=85968 RepID=UPI000AFF620F|nr:hypothetical protein [Mycolicibacterium brumae]MCV7193766.1 hypothetical protein [Mycolicibacterium brumae]UWW07316.1 hypothetical protein L2Z93_000321 [Mycolicibacterium brumae]